MLVDNILMRDVIDYNKKRKNAFYNGEVLEINPDFERILKARYNKVSRIKKRLIYLLTRCNYVYFCTFTFSDKVLNFNDEYKRRLIKWTLRDFDVDIKYILNKDFGDLTEREHYHCIVGTNINLNLNSFIQDKYPCHCLAIKVRNTSDDVKRLSKYINKLTNHCVKDSTCKSRVICNFKGYDDLPGDLKHKYYVIDKYLMIDD